MELTALIHEDGRLVFRHVQFSHHYGPDHVVCVILDGPEANQVTILNRSCLREDFSVLPSQFADTDCVSAL